MSKSYNPFKMWGSWVGAMLTIPLMILMGESGFINILLGKLLKPLMTASPIAFFGFYWLFILIFGFLLGWGIHSIIRAVRK